VNVELHERLVADIGKTVNLARFHDENVTRSRLTRFAVHDPPPAALLDERNFIIRMTVRARPAPGRRVDKVYRDRDAALIRTDELVGHADEWKILLTNRVHER